MKSFTEFGQRSKDRHGAGCTPFRYPGGKAFIADFLEQKINAADHKITTYAEPFAGGAGAAIELLARGTIDRVILNDFDRRVHAAWWAILYRTNEFIDRIRSTEVTVDTWLQFRHTVEENSKDGDAFELGFATYVLNRTNRSGVIIGAGPIGGYKQNGKWLIDARWYADTMSRRIAWLGERRDQFELRNEDAIQFLISFEENDARQTFFFIDPPYVKAGAKLYFNAMNDLKHMDLAEYLTGSSIIQNWLVTYDECQLIANAYRSAIINRVPVRYSLHRKRTEQEIYVVPASSCVNASSVS